MGGRLPLEPVVLGELCRRHEIPTLSLFGSTLKGTARADKNVDLLGEFFPDARPTLLDVTQRELVIELAGYLQKRLDVVRPSKASAARVLRELGKNQRLG